MRRLPDVRPARLPGRVRCPGRRPARVARGALGSAGDAPLRVGHGARRRLRRRRSPRERHALRVSSLRRRRVERSRARRDRHPLVGERHERDRRVGRGRTRAHRPLGRYDVRRARLGHDRDALRSLGCRRRRRVGGGRNTRRRRRGAERRRAPLRRDGLGAVASAAEAGARVLQGVGPLARRHVCRRRSGNGVASPRRAVVARVEPAGRRGHAPHGERLWVERGLRGGRARRPSLGRIDVDPPRGVALARERRERRLLRSSRTGRSRRGRWPQGAPLDGVWEDDFVREPHTDLHGVWADPAGGYWAAGGDFASGPLDGGRRAGVLAYYGDAAPSSTFR